MMTQAQLVDVLWERLTRDGPVEGVGMTMTREYERVDSALRGLAGELVEPYRSRSGELRAAEDAWLDEVAEDATQAALRHAIAAMTQSVLRDLPTAPASLRAVSERLFVDLALPRDQALPEHLRPGQAA